MSSTSTSAWWYIRSELGKQKTLPRSSIKAVCQTPTAAHKHLHLSGMLWTAGYLQLGHPSVHLMLRRVWSRVVQLTPVPGTLGGREGLPSPKSNTNSTVATSLTSLDHKLPHQGGELQLPCSPITVGGRAFGYQSVLAVENRRPPVQS